MEYPIRAEAFPVGLRVLVVDDDPTWSKILEKMLRKCSYEVTTCCLARVALDLLRERREKFDIVISDVNMPDMDGFKLLEHVGLEMDVPVIMMSVDGETSRVMKGVQHGACDYLLKPIRMKELRNIWQHVYRKKIHEVREIESHDISDDEDFDDRQVSGGVDFSSSRKRKDWDSKESSDQESADPAAVKKARVVWSVDLHQKFVNAVNHIGFDKVGPKKILDLMNVPGLTRENVASHLQKYRLYLSRLQRQSEGKSSAGSTQSDFNPKRPQAHVSLQNTTTMHENNAAGRYIPITQNSQAHNRTSDVHVDEINGAAAAALHVKDQTEAVTPDIPNPGKLNGGPPLGVLSFSSTASNVSEHQPWSGGIPVMQFMQYTQHDHEPYSLLEDCLCLPLTTPVHPPFTCQLQTPPSIASLALNAKDKTGLDQIKPVFANYKSSNNENLSQVTCTVDFISVQAESGIVHSQDYGSTSWSPPLRESSMKNGTDLVSLPEDLPLCTLQNIRCFENGRFNSMDIFQYCDSTSLSEFPNNWYDGLELNCEYYYDQIEYPIIDDCLFA